MKWVFLFLLTLSVLRAENSDPFLHQAGVEQRFLQTEEDFKRLGKFSALLQVANQRAHPQGTIPKTLHFIWLGPQPLPAGSIETIAVAQKLHPDWKVKLWTDHKRDIAGVQQVFFETFPLGKHEKLYFESDNYGERSELLRYAILANEGGVYVDHDVVFLKPLDPLQEAYDFFCGLEFVGRSVLSSSVNPSSHLIAATAQHPILKTALGWLQQEWERLERHFPGSDPSSLFNRVQHRTFRALSVGIEKEQNKEERRDAVLPPAYFSLSEKTQEAFCMHRHLGTWHKKVSEVEKKLETQLEKAVGESKRSSMLAFALLFLQLLILALIFYKKR